MPDTPDFEQLARQLHTLIAPWPRSVGEQEIVAQLRLVWNARGAADQHAIEERLATLTGWVTSEPYQQHLREAIATVDR